MSTVQFLILALVALIVAVLTVKFVPRVRQSALFDGVLFGATWLLAFVCAWYAVGQLETTVPLAALELDAFARRAGAAIVLGAVGGALALNLALWLIDRLIPLAADEMPAEAEEDHSDDSASSG